MREAKRTWIKLLVVAALAGVAGCASRPERLPRCEGEAKPINVPGHSAGNAGSGERGQ